MADRRMFTKKITESDAFLDMCPSSQMLYFHLSMNADDDGFVNNPRKIQRMCGASNDDYDTLVEKRFILEFESGVIVIKHWKMHNYIQSDRYKPTDYKEEKGMLILKDNNSYTFDTEDDYSGGTDSGKYKEEMKEIISYLNEKCGTRYKYSTNVTKMYLRARLSEGFTLDDFKTVIDKKTDEWLGTGMAKFLRPQTLFCTKFESYLNQIDHPKSEAEGWAES